MSKPERPCAMGQMLKTCLIEKWCRQVTSNHHHRPYLITTSNSQTISVQSVWTVLIPTTYSTTNHTTTIPTPTTLTDQANLSTSLPNPTACSPINHTTTLQTPTTCSQVSVNSNQLSTSTFQPTFNSSQKN